MPPKKEEAPAGPDPFKEILIGLLALYFVWLIYNRIEVYLQYKGYTSAGALWQVILRYLSVHVLPVFELFSVIVSVLSISGIVYSYKKLSALILEEKAIYSPEKAHVEIKEDLPAPNEKWERVISHTNSANMADWKLAIIEADIMLQDVLEAAGYHGETIGEMLKAVQTGDFVTLEAAWEAHKVRNQIAHQGGDFILTERDAKRVISLYESVFKEFKVI